MQSTRINHGSRSLETARSRRTFIGVLVTLALATLSATDGIATKKDKKRTSQSKRCKSRHSEKEILGFIAKAAEKYGQSKKAMERVARCESGLDPCAVNRRGPYYGLFQFLKSTWKSTPYKDRSIYDPEAQALATAWMWKKGRKDEWACQ